MTNSPWEFMAVSAWPGGGTTAQEPAPAGEELLPGVDGIRRERRSRAEAAVDRRRRRENKKGRGPEKLLEEKKVNRMLSYRAQAPIDVNSEVRLNCLDLECCRYICMQVDISQHR